MAWTNSSSSSLPKSSNAKNQNRTVSGTAITSIDTTIAEIETTIETARRDIGIVTATTKEIETGTGTAIERAIGIERGIGTETETTIAVADIIMNTATMMMTVDTREAAEHATRTMATRSTADGAIERIDITNHQTKRPMCLLQTRRSLQTRMQPAHQNHWNEMLG